MMSKEAMKLALEALDGLYLPGELERVNKAITALREALAEQPAQQEPVAWGLNRFIEDDNGCQIGTDDPELTWGKYAPDDNGWWPLYTSPPASKPWVGLTEAEKIKCRSYDPEEAVAKTEAKLREKNA